MMNPMKLNFSICIKTQVVQFYINKVITANGYYCKNYRGESEKAIMHEQQSTTKTERKGSYLINELSDQTSPVAINGLGTILF